MISCFMVIRNGLDLGYPFIESIQSALPICDEFFISDGYSSDETFEALVKYFGNEPKIRLFRDKWEQRSLKGSALRNALNVIRSRCKGGYIMEIDANEIIPSEDVELIRDLPRLYPDKEIFGFPFYQIMGSQILFTEEFRFRFAKNLKAVKVLWDAFTMGHHLDLSVLFEKGTLKRVINRFLTVFLEERISGGFIPEQYIYLPKPIFKYYSIFPENFFNKMESKLYLQPGRGYSNFTMNSESSPLKKIWTQYQETGDYVKFWDQVYDFHIEQLRKGVNLNKEFTEKRIINEQEQPESIRKLFGKRKYELPA